jgi:phosphatidylserine/phosphatidylglycerophosphate/cardiolipin synthase-like enzyme
VSTRDLQPDASVLAAWFLTGAERGNDASVLARDPAWTRGNAVVPLVHGAAYFERLAACLRTLGRGDGVLITDWRGDHDEKLTDDGTTVGGLLAELARRGVEVRALLWRSHPGFLGFQEQAQVELARQVNDAGGEVLLDERVRRFGSHHQKLVLVERGGIPEVGFVGGIDLCHGRRDDADHEGDPQREDLDPVYGPRPGWHDLQAEVRGPALGDLAATFRERWNDRTPLEQRATPLGAVRARVSRAPTRPDRLEPAPAPSVAGSCAVQVLRTYPKKSPPFPFAPDGERSIARLYRKALTRARALVYVEDQYLWYEEVATVLADALRRAPELRLIAVVPRYPERDGTLSGPVYRVGQRRVMDLLMRAGPGRVAVYDLENDEEHPIYVHAKAVVVDDVLAVIGSDNLNRRSWTHDSELSIAVIDDERDERSPTDPGGSGDGARRFARDLRLALWREHLEASAADDDELLDPVTGFERWRRTAAELEAWHAGGRRGPRPPGQVRRHEVRRPSAVQRVWAEPVFRVLVDPDGRPHRRRRTDDF